MNGMIPITFPSWVIFDSHYVTAVSIMSCVTFRHGLYLIPIMYIPFPSCVIFDSQYVIQFPSWVIFDSQYVIQFPSWVVFDSHYVYPILIMSYI